RSSPRQCRSLGRAARVPDCARLEPDRHSAEAGEADVRLEWAVRPIVQFRVAQFRHRSMPKGLELLVHIAQDPTRKLRAAINQARVDLNQVRTGADLLKRRLSGINATGSNDR